MDEWTVLAIDEILPDQQRRSVKRRVFNFDVTLKVSRSGDGFQEVFVGLDLVDEGYAILVDYHLSHKGNVIFEKEKTLWCPETGQKNRYPTLDCDFCAFRGEAAFKEVKDLKLEVCPRAMLSIVDVSQSTGFRTFLVKSGSHEFYVNPSALEDLGGALFESWKKLADKGQKEIVVPDDANLRRLIEACVRYDRPLIHSENFMTIGWCALSIGSTKLLRAVEDFVCSLRTMNPFRKLEIAGELRLARLFKEAQTAIGQPLVAHRKLLEYAHSNHIDLDDLHPVIQSIGLITPADICTM